MLPWMQTATALLGTKEIPGNADNKSIVEWAELIGGDVWKQYKHDSTPWCGLFVAHCLTENGIEPSDAPLWALSWSTWQAATTPRYGAVLSFKRPEGGHVGFYVSEDSESYHVLGGNQSDMVNVARVPKVRFVAARAPADYLHLMDSKRIVTAFAGSLSTNEA